MQGIEILTATEVATSFMFNWKAFWITIIAVVFIGFMVGLMNVIIDGEDLGILISTTFCGIIFGALLGALTGGVLCEIPIEYETQYKVTVSEEVSMKEFCEHYEVIKQDGKIFTIREKTNESE